MSKKIGIIDLGSNSVRLVIFEIMPNGAFKLIDDIKDTIRLSENMIDGKLLNDLAMHKAVKTIKLYRKLCNSYGIPCNRIIGVATAAVRKAENRDQFLRLLSSSTDINFRLISGEEEASYVYKATIYSLDIHEGVIVDIGGGSTEIISFKDNSITNSISIPIGSVVATESFLGKDTINPDQLALLEDSVRKMLKEQSWLWQEGNRTLIGLGGVIRNLGKIHRNRVDYPINHAHNYEMKIDDFYSIYDDLKSMDLKSRKKVKGISSSRADIIVGGLAILKTIISICSPSHILISGFGLREGILFDYITATNPRVKFTDALSFSLTNFMELYGVRKNHAKHVCFLALSLFDQLKHLHNYGEEVRKLLKVASLLHDIGISMGYYEHYRHSFYIILNSRLTGLTHRETLLIAAIAASHSKDKFKENWQKRYKKILLPGDTELWEKLSVFLKLAECLDRSETAVIKALECHILADSVKIQTIREGDSELEISLANEYSNTFRKVFGKYLIVT
ncbi:Ppx/GppA phosphatase family protein [Acetivibrio mesophilus]|uniref:Ppx/GppA family phosphatase n=1 Tax=Acetivibrio mesophilus TaxID=2487273 RepID=A0A4V1K1U0_9FIRM|nr:Ppx/GppA phosphatase family protein [Acetivibrio mesophilus]ODM27383.1 exopolyphosphatase [Clostridium sp. Bc-iso-3]RXE57959.1 Ppx/GppA family phosphatase [Acetivibrio mesophilus]HHV28986.1 Ppx/GppA family phosphatase [Clostridium sp.]